MQTDLSKLQQFKRRVSLSHAQLGIPPDYGQSCGLKLCPEPEELVDTELDFYQRPQKLGAAALRAWSLRRAGGRAGGVGP